jgi:4-hydroxy-3-methylbut-2-en-1-yl diphosphate synthase IspG/GcpE
VNSGSVEKPLLEKYGLCAQALCESALGHVKLLEDCGMASGRSGNRRYRRYYAE